MAEALNLWNIPEHPYTRCYEATNYPSISHLAYFETAQSLTRTEILHERGLNALVIPFIRFRDHSGLGTPRDGREIPTRREEAGKLQW